MVSFKTIKLPGLFLPILSFVLLLGLQGCAARTQPKMTRIDISNDIKNRTGHTLKTDDSHSGILLPPGVQFDDGLTLDEAIATALWNNADFQAALGSMGIARADLVEAGLLRNPILSILFPLGPKQLESVVNWAVESLWQRPQRIAIAHLDLEKIAHTLVQYGLDLEHRVGLAHTALLLAQEKAKLNSDAYKLEQEIVQIAEVRLRAGDISEAESLLARTRLLLVEESNRRSQAEITNAANDLRALMGLGSDNRQIHAVANNLPTQDLPAVPELLADAFASRPDLRASELAIEAAGERLGLEKQSIWKITAILDMNGEGKEGFEAGPGILAELPLLNTNQGGKARASAQLEQAMLNYAAVQQQIASEVLSARDRFSQAAVSYYNWERQILPPLVDSVAAARSAFSAGEISYLGVLEANQRLLQNKLQVMGVVSEFRIAACDLDRGIGRNQFAK
jgi:cobalt-zinc-cadmium efflux system outer membrane protein